MRPTHSRVGQEMGSSRHGTIKHEAGRRSFSNWGGLDQTLPGAGCFAMRSICACAARMDPPAGSRLRCDPDRSPDSSTVFQGPAGATGVKSLPPQPGVGIRIPKNHFQLARELSPTGRKPVPLLHKLSPRVATCPAVGHRPGLVFELFHRLPSRCRARPLTLFRWGCRHSTDGSSPRTNRRPTRPGDGSGHVSLPGLTVVNQACECSRTQAGGWGGWGPSPAGPVNPVQASARAPYCAQPMQSGAAQEEPLPCLESNLRKLRKPFPPRPLVLFGERGWSRKGFRPRGFQRLGFEDRVMLQES